MADFFDGFETNDFSLWDDAIGGASVVASPVYTGSYSFKSLQDGRLENYGVGSYSDFYYGFRFRIDDVTTYIRLGWIYNTTWTQALTFGVVSGAFYLTAPSGTYTAGTAAVDTWYGMLIRRKVGAGNGLAELWINGTRLINRTTETITNNSDKIKLGMEESGGQIAYFDDVSYDTAYIDYSVPSGVSIPVMMHHYNTINKIIRG